MTWTIGRSARSRLLRQRAADARGVEDSPAAVEQASAPATVPVLAITRSGPDCCVLERTLRGNGWALVCVDNCAAALALLDERSFPVVIYDRDVASADWRLVFRSILASRHPACVLLASTVTDTYLWEAVIQHGGFDVLAKPYDRDQVLRVLRFALAHWKTGWIRRRWECFWECA